MFSLIPFFPHQPEKPKAEEAGGLVISPDVHVNESDFEPPVWLLSRAHIHSMSPPQGGNEPARKFQLHLQGQCNDV